MVDYNYDYDYSDLYDNLIDEATSRQDYGGAATGLLSGIGGMAGDVAEGFMDLVGPSYGAAGGYGGYGGYGGLGSSEELDLPTIADLYSSGSLTASNAGGVPDIYATPGGGGIGGLDTGFDLNMDDIIDAMYEDLIFQGDTPPPGGDTNQTPGPPGPPGGDTNQMGPPKPEEEGGFLPSLLAALGLGGLGQGGIMGALGTLLGTTLVGKKGSDSSGLFGGSPLMQFLAIKSLMGDDKGSGAPIGQQAYGQAQPFNYQDYQPTNLQPALMPGVGYANVGAPPPDVGIPEVPGMQIGGEVGEPTKWDILTAIQNDQVIDLGDGSIAVNINGQYETISAERMAEIKDHSNKSGIIVGSYWGDSLPDMPLWGFNYEGMQSGGTVRPGDVTFAKLEPGEFVIQKPAVDAVGIETLEQINNMGNGRPYYG